MAISKNTTTDALQRQKEAAEEQTEAAERMLELQQKTKKERSPKNWLKILLYGDKWQDH